MKKIILLLILFVSTNSLYAQVGGLSASKLGTYCTETVPAQNIEFEPFFSYAATNHYFDKNGNIQDLFETEDSVQFFSSFGFRFSYGLFKDFEIGVVTPIDISRVSFGAKYKLPFGNKLTYGVMFGYNSVIGNAVYVKRNAAHESTSAFAGGIIMTYEANSRFGLDINAQYQKHINTTVDGHSEGVYASMDMGYYLIQDVSFILGMNYFYKKYDTHENNSNLFTLSPGITIEKAKNFILVISAPLDVMGKNEYKTSGFSLALTILLD